MRGRRNKMFQTELTYNPNFHAFHENAKRVREKAK